MNNRIDIHDRVLKSKDTKELMEAYGDWARRYDDDLVDDWGYVAPTAAADMLMAATMVKSATILDAGCGTGLVGARLADAGYQTIDGLDYSAAMLERARSKGVYRKLMQANLNDPLDLPSDGYDAVACVGTFTSGHVGADALDELIRITRPGGHICFTVRAESWEHMGFAEKIPALEDAGAWRRKTLDEIDYIRREGARCQLALYEACA